MAQINNLVCVRFNYSKNLLSMWNLTKVDPLVLCSVLTTVEISCLYSVLTTVEPLIYVQF
jgi:hypothetical protein